MLRNALHIFRNMGFRYAAYRAWHEVGKMGGDIPGSWPTSRCLPKTC